MVKIERIGLEMGVINGLGKAREYQMDLYI
jgi:hypothetical protein